MIDCIYMYMIETKQTFQFCGFPNCFGWFDSHWDYVLLSESKTLINIDLRYSKLHLCLENYFTNEPFYR